MEKKNFETSMRELENIVTKLEEGTVELDSALSLFEKGIKLSKELRNTLDKAEQKVTKLVAEDPGSEVLFDEPAE